MPDFRNYGSFNSQDVAELAARYREMIIKNPNVYLSEKHNTLYSLAEKSGNKISPEEKRFLELLPYKDKEDVLTQTVLKRGFNPVKFTVEGEVYQLNSTSSEQPFKTTPHYSLNLPGSGFDKMMADKKVKTSDLQSEIKILAKERFPAVQEKITRFINNYPALNEAGGESLHSKEAMIYLRYMINQREPVLSPAVLGKILDKLEAMTSETFDPRIGNARILVTCALHDLACPSNISQNSIGTCVAASIQIQLALKDPLKYLDLLTSLAKDKEYDTGTIRSEGKLEFKYGPGNVITERKWVFSDTPQKIKPDWSFINESQVISEADKADPKVKRYIGSKSAQGDENGNKLYHNTNRSLSSKIMQNALMEFADGDKRDFNSAVSDEGLSDDQALKTQEALFNQVKQLKVYRGTPDYMLEILRKAEPAMSNPVQLMMRYSETGRDSQHSVDVVGINDKTIRIINPWGREETISAQIARHRFISVIAPDKL